MARKTSKLSRPVKTIFLIYCTCFLFRAVEYFVLRTDQSVFGEAFIHKLAGIFLLVLILRYYSAGFGDIGFTARRAGRFILYGLLLGAAVFFVAYGAEYALQMQKGQNPQLELYVSSFTVTGNSGNRVGLIIFAICIIGNIINVIMEEGVFRGVFIKLGEKKYSFLMTALLSSALFGFWHVTAPARSFWDGEISAQIAVITALMLVIPAGLMGFKLCMLTKITGSLWMPMADHFFNNMIVNILHIAADTGSDQFLTLRITVAQSLSFLIVLFLFFKTGARRKKTFR